jgi:hypothetical protein
VSKVSFAADIKPPFRAIDIEHMKPFGVKLDDDQYMSDPSSNHQHAQDLADSLSPQDGGAPAMPPGGPYWTADQLALFARLRGRYGNPKMPRHIEARQ